MSVLLNETVAGAATPSFAAQQTFATGSFPRSVAAGDLNRDGKLDLAIANSYGNTVSVLLNTTDTNASTPSFTAQQTFATGLGPISAAAVDLNGDGRPDLAVTNSNADTVSVLLAVPSGAIQISGVSTSVSEGSTAGAVTLSRTGSTDGQVSAILSVTGGAATQGYDYVLASPQTVTWTDGDGADKTVSIPIIPDEVDEADETIQFTVSLPTNPFGASLGSQTTTTVTILDDDSPSLSIANVSQAEGDSGASPMTFTVTRTGSLTMTSTVQYTTTNGSATDGSDYTTTSGTLTFTPTESSKTIPVPVLGDTTPESDETFTVTLSTPTNANLGTAQAIGIIQNDDGDDPPSLSIANVSQAEGDSGTSPMTFTVTRTGSLTVTSTVQYATANGSATAGSDYTATSGTLTFAPNEGSKTIAIPILGDTTVEPDETFTLTLSNPTNATLGTAQAVGIIQNDDIEVAPQACTPRPRVTQTLAAGGGALTVHIESTPLNTPANNPLQQIQFGAFQNATVTLNGQTVSGGQTVTLPANTVGAEMEVRRVTAGQPTIVHMTIVDGCGAWQTFVGGGTGAGF